MDDDLINSLKEQMDSLSKQMQEAQAFLAPLEDKMQEVNSAEYQIRESYKEQLAKIADQKIEILNAQSQYKNIVNSVTVEINNINYKIQQAEQEKAKAEAEAKAKAAEAEQYLALAERFDKETMGAPWREWAKDHQIQAGHKITQDRYVILGDPMGLGKTLSSIVTADMVEKTTKACSPDFPFLGTEKTVWVPDTFVWTEQGIKEYEAREGYFAPDAYFKNDIFNGRFRNTEPSVGAPFPGYVAYDMKNRMLDRGLIENIPGHYEEKIVNAIERPVGRKILYFCPSPLLRNVLEEWRKWAPHRNVTYIGTMSKLERKFALSTLPQLQDYVIIVNYEAWRRDKALLDELAACKFDTVIIDEAHMIKDMKSQAFKGVKKIITECNPEYVIPMTGTPILNRPQELFSLLNIILPEEFNNERDYLWRYCEEYETDDGQSRWRFKPGGLDLLVKKLSKNFLRRTKDQVGINLPDKTIIFHELDLDEAAYPKQSKARTHMKKYATLVLDNKGKALQATVMIALITRLRQIETWPAGIKQIDPNTKETILELGEEFAESQKIDYIIRKDKETNDWEGLIPDTVEDERIVVFSQFKAPLAELKRRVEAAGYRAVVLDGSTSSNLRDEIRYDFDRSITPNRADSKWDVLLANYKAAGVGLNLTNATQLITLDEEWNPGKREQAWDRIHRIGQTQAVTINVVRTKGTIDTWLANIIGDKAKVVDGFNESMGSLTIEDFKEFLDGGSGLA